MRLADKIEKDWPFKTEEEGGRNMRLADKIGKDWPFKTEEEGGREHEAGG